MSSSPGLPETESAIHEAIPVLTMPLLNVRRDALASRNAKEVKVMSPLEATFRAAYPVFLLEENEPITILEKGQYFECIWPANGNNVVLADGDDLVGTLRSALKSASIKLKNQGASISIDGDVSDVEIEKINRAGALFKKSKGHLIGFCFRPIPYKCWEAGFVRKKSRGPCC